MPSFAVEMLASLPDSFWPDLTKTLVGSFVGAGLAFFSNYWIQRRERIRKQKAAGNFALSVLARQFNDFLVLRRGYDEEKQRLSGHSPPLPRWLTKPIHYYFSDSLRIDFESLAFLFELSSSGKMFSSLILAEQRYCDLAKLIQSFGAAAEKLQERISSVPAVNGEYQDIRLFPAAIGPDLLGKVESLLDGIDRSFSDDQRVYEESLTELRRSLIREFGECGIIAAEVAQSVRAGRNP